MVTAAAPASAWSSTAAPAADPGEPRAPRRPDRQRRPPRSPRLAVPRRGRRPRRRPSRGGGRAGAARTPGGPADPRAGPRAGAARRRTGPPAPHGATRGCPGVRGPRPARHGRRLAIRRPETVSHRPFGSSRAVFPGTGRFPGARLPAGPDAFRTAVEMRCGKSTRSTRRSEGLPTAPRAAPLLPPLELTAAQFTAARTHSSARRSPEAHASDDARTETIGKPAGILRIIESSAGEGHPGAHSGRTGAHSRGRAQGTPLQRPARER